jgi:hypothetical protein
MNSNIHDSANWRSAIWKSKLASAIALLDGPFLIWHVME